MERRWRSATEIGDRRAGKSHIVGRVAQLVERVISSVVRLFDKVFGSIPNSSTTNAISNGRFRFSFPPLASWCGAGVMAKA